MQVFPAQTQEVLGTWEDWLSSMGVVIDNNDGFKIGLIKVRSWLTHIWAFDTHSSSLMFSFLLRKMKELNHTILTGLLSSCGLSRTPGISFCFFFSGLFGRAKVEEKK